MSFFGVLDDVPFDAFTRVSVEDDVVVVIGLPMGAV
jgi:hypothetical protein